MSDKEEGWLSDEQRKYIASLTGITRTTFLSQTMLGNGPDMVGSCGSSNDGKTHSHHGKVATKSEQEARAELDKIKIGDLAKNFTTSLFDMVHILSYERDEKFDSILGKLTPDYITRLLRGKTNVKPGDRRTEIAALPESLGLLTLSYDEIQTIQYHGAKFIGHQYQDTGYPLLSDRIYSSSVGKIVLPCEDIDKNLKELCKIIKLQIADALRRNDREKAWLIASEFKLRFIAIHPYKDGCGRTSRLIVDRILKEFGLTLPRWEEMKKINDLVCTVTEYAELLSRASR